MFTLMKNMANLGVQSLRLRSNHSEFMQQKSETMILNLLASERGLALKIAQVLGSNEQSQSVIQSAASGKDLEGLPLSELTKTIELSLGQKMEEIFEDLEEARWVASVGQVHPCHLKNKIGHFVLKVQYPDIHKKVKEQLRLLGLVGKLGSKTKLKKWGFDIGSYLNEFEMLLEKEMDYRGEANNLFLFSKLNSARELYYPQVVSEFLRPNLIITTFMPGLTIDEFIQRSNPEQKKSFGERFLKTYLEQLLIDGFIQGDTHKGNFKVYEDKPVYLDFGHFIKLDEKQKNALKYLFKNSMNHEFTNSLGLLKELNFDIQKLEMIEDKLPQLMKILLKPFSDNQNFDLKGWKPKAEIEEILGEHKWWFRSSGSADFFQLLRSLWGPCLILKELSIPLNWHMILKSVLAQTTAPSPVQQLKAKKEKTIAEHLRIEVFKSTEKTVDLFLPARAVKNIETLMDDKIKAKIAKKGFDIYQIKDKAIAADYAAMKLFDFQDGEKRYKIYLE